MNIGSVTWITWQCEDERLREAFPAILIPESRLEFLEPEKARSLFRRG
jgi:hypothetical protein